VAGCKGGQLQGRGRRIGRRAGERMARSIWTGSISFGLVNIPVRLFSAVAHKEVRFHMLHREDGGRIQLKRVCSVDGKEIAFDDITKGYELSKGRYVMIEPDELEKLEPKTTHAIEIEDFVQLSEIDPIFYEATYHLAPDERGGKAYNMLVTAMEKAQRVAIARMVMRTRKYLCAVRPTEGRLLLSTMQYADEIIPYSALDAPKSEASPKPREVEMAEQLIDSLTTSFDPKKYKDDYRAKVVDLVEKKAEGQEIVSPEAPAVADIGSLADALSASLKRTQSEKRPAHPPARGARRAPQHRALRPAARTRRTKK
jgi:DNA end-binding protein Ku